MVLESTMFCVDNSEYMRNGDFSPMRLQAQQDAVVVVCKSKTRSNPENNVGLLTMANNVEVLMTLQNNPDTGRFQSKLHAVQPRGDISFCTAIRVAHLALKHRQGKNHKMRIVAFVGSPVEDSEKDLVRLAKRLKKEKVNVDVVSFGEEEANAEKLAAFMGALNGSEGTGSHLAVVPPGANLADALVSSHILDGGGGEGGSMMGLGAGDFEFGVDPSNDPELALALRVSMEEQRAAAASASAEAGGGAGGGGMPPPTTTAACDARPGGSEEEPDFGSMTEEEQITYALQMSLSGGEFGDIMDTSGGAPMDDDDADAESTARGQQEEEEEEEENDVMQDPEFLQSVMENLPGVDPNDEAIRNAISSLVSSSQPEKKDAKKDAKKDEDTKK